MKHKHLALAALACIITLPASAIIAGPEDHPPVLDKVTFSLEAEDWVQTSTAKVTVSIDAALQGSDAGTVRTDMQKAVAALADGADWKFAAFDRSQDQSGLETWHASLETRLREADLGGLADKAKKASRPGLQLKIENIEFTPSLAEEQAANTKLRSQVYGMVKEELKRLNDADPGRNYRIGEIEFDAGEPPHPHPVPMMRRFTPAATAAIQQEPEETPVTVQQKATLTANVTLEASVPKDADSVK